MSIYKDIYKNRIKFIFVIFLFILLGLIGFKKIFSESVSTYISAKEILDRMSLSVYGLSTYKCDVKINASVVNFGLNFSFNGEVYYKEPDKLFLKLKDLPEDVQEKYRLSFTQTSVPGMVSKIYKEKYTSKVISVRNLGTTKVYVLYMEPIKSRAIKNVLMFVDSYNYTIPKSIIYYKDGGKITIDQKYSKIDKYYLPSYQEVYFDFPKVQASLVSNFYNYKLNIPLSDDLFKK
ncbi:MAG: hypothetical protein N2485_05055 [bacterium]|nr:hypothetical protein [bacterium]